MDTQSKEIALRKTEQTDIVRWQQNWKTNYEVIKITAKSTPAEILTSNTPALSQLGKTTSGNMRGIVVFKAVLISIVRFIDVDWHEDVITECAEIAYAEYYWFTMAELKQFSLRVKSGYYESNKNIKPMVLMGFMSEYSQERLQSRYDYYSQQKALPVFVLKLSKVTKGKSVGEKICAVLERVYQSRMKELRAKLIVSSFTEKEKAAVVKATPMFVELVEQQMVDGYDPDGVTYKGYLKAIGWKTKP